MEGNWREIRHETKQSLRMVNRGRMLPGPRHGGPSLGGYRYLGQLVAHKDRGATICAAVHRAAVLSIIYPRPHSKLCKSGFHHTAHQRMTWSPFIMCSSIGNRRSGGRTEDEKHWISAARTLDPYRGWFLDCLPALSCPLVSGWSGSLSRRLSAAAAVAAAPLCRWSAAASRSREKTTSKNNQERLRGNRLFPVAHVEIWETTSRRKMWWNLKGNKGRGEAVNGGGGGGLRSSLWWRRTAFSFSMTQSSQRRQLHRSTYHFQ